MFGFMVVQYLLSSSLLVVLLGVCVTFFRTYDDFECIDVEKL